MDTNENPNEISTPSVFWDGMREDLIEKAPEGIKDSSLVKSSLRHLDETRKAVESVNDSIKKNLKDPFNGSPEVAKAKSREYGQKVYKNFEKRSDNVLKAISSEINVIDQKIDKNLFKEASGPYSDSIRKHVQSLPETQRATFISKLISEENFEAASSILHPRHYFLSGIDEKTRKLLLEEYKAKRFSGEIQNRKYLKMLEKKIRNGHYQLHRNFEVLEDEKTLNAIKLHRAAEDAMT